MDFLYIFTHVAYYIFMDVSFSIKYFIYRGLRFERYKTIRPMHKAVARKNTQH